jgi:hypothetical protein
MLCSATVVLAHDCPTKPLCSYTKINILYCYCHAQEGISHTKQKSKQKSKQPVEFFYVLIAKGQEQKDENNKFNHCSNNCAPTMRYNCAFFSSSIWL